MKVFLAVVISLIFISHGVSNLEGQELTIADSPVAVASFGAAVCDDYLYLFGGNEGTAHSFSLEGQNNVFRRVKLESGAKWEELGEVDRRQGNALVMYDGKLYQVGGFESRNKEDEAQDMHSSKDFRVFDPETKKWTTLADLPEARSSFDAVVLGDTLFAMGGWSLNGEDEESDWHATAWKIDLSDAKSKWQPIKNPPLVRRANSTAHFNDKIYVIGGMKQQGGPTTEVSVYDPENDTWSKGPSLPGDNMQGFGNSSFNVSGRLIVSTINGQILQLDEDGKAWNKIHQMEAGRFFHRLVPIDSHRFVVLCGVDQVSEKQHSVLVFDLDKFGTATEAADQNKE